MLPDYVIPADFLDVPIAHLRHAGDTLGYRGSARYIGFYWEPAADVLAWFDGRSLTVGQGDAGTFFRQVIPMSYVHGVNLGSRGEATHFFVWDQIGECGYLAPWQSALDFLGAQDGMIGLQSSDGIQAIPPLA